MPGVEYQASNSGAREANLHTRDHTQDICQKRMRRVLCDSPEPILSSWAGEAAFRAAVHSLIKTLPFAPGLRQLKQRDSHRSVRGQHAIPGLAYGFRVVREVLATSTLPKLQPDVLLYLLSCIRAYYVASLRHILLGGLSRTQSSHAYSANMLPYAKDIRQPKWGDSLRLILCHHTHTEQSYTFSQHTAVRQGIRQPKQDDSLRCCETQAM